MSQSDSRADDERLTDIRTSTKLMSTIDVVEVNRRLYFAVSLEMIKADFEWLVSEIDRLKEYEGKSNDLCK